MSIVQTEWWCVELPEEWSASIEDDCVTIEDCDGVGNIDITAMRKSEGDISLQELEQFAAELIEQGLSSVDTNVAACQGLYFSYEEEGLAWREWYLRQSATLVYITYHCENENKGLDDAVVDEILSTLSVLDG